MIITALIVSSSSPQTCHCQGLALHGYYTTCRWFAWISFVVLCLYHTSLFDDIQTMKDRLFSSLSSILDKCVIQTVNPLAAIITVSINKSKWDKISWCSTQTHWCSVMMTQLWQLTIAIFYYKYKSVPMTKHRHRYHLYCDVELNLELLWAVTLFYNHIVVYSYCFMVMPMIFYSFASRFMPPFKLQSVCQRF